MWPSQARQMFDLGEMSFNVRCYLIGKEYQHEMEEKAMREADRKAHMPRARRY